MKKLQNLAHASEDTIYSITACFPFEFFPDKLIIDKNKVTVIRNHFFLKRTYPILIEDILTVKFINSYILASLDFEVKGYEENPQPIQHLIPRQALKAKQYIMGLKKAKNEKIDVTMIPLEELRKRLLEIGGNPQE